MSEYPFIEISYRKTNTSTSRWSRQYSPEDIFGVEPKRREPHRVDGEDADTYLFKRSV